MRRIATWMAAAAIALAPSAFAQQAKGNVYGRIADESAAGT